MSVKYITWAYSITIVIFLIYGTEIIRLWILRPNYDQINNTFVYLLLGGLLVIPSYIISSFSYSSKTQHIYTAFFLIESFLSVIFYYFCSKFYPFIYFLYSKLIISNIISGIFFPNLLFKIS